MEPLLLDACVVINLVASAIPLGALAEANNVRWTMTRLAASEAFWLAPEVDGGDRERIDMAALAQGRSLDLSDLAGAELTIFVRLARQIDDGEAATLAAAVHRGHRVATDDRRAQRVARSFDPEVQIVTTAQLMAGWAAATGARDDEVATVLLAIERRASFVPRRDDPEHDWWTRMGTRPAG